MSLLDFSDYCVYPCDNAIEASAEASQPHVSIAFLKNGAQETFIIENSIKEEGIDIYWDFLPLEPVLKGRREELVSIPSWKLWKAILIPV